MITTFQGLKHAHPCLSQKTLIMSFYLMKLNLELSQTVNDITHPMDCVEQLCINQEFSTDRAHSDKLSIRAVGDYGPYLVDFNWNENIGTIEVFCQTGWLADEQDIDLTARTLAEVNSQLLIGHFDINEDGMICFRHTLLFRGVLNMESFEPVLEVLNIALSSCDRFHGLFALIKENNIHNRDILDLALISVEGHA